MYSVQVEDLREDPVAWQEDLLQKDYDLFDGQCITNYKWLPFFKTAQIWI